MFGINLPNGFDFQKYAREAVASALGLRLAEEKLNLDPATGKLKPAILRVTMGETQFGNSVHIITDRSVPSGLKLRVPGLCGQRLAIVEHWSVDVVFSDRPVNLCMKCEEALLVKHPNDHLWFGPKKLIVAEAA